MIKEHKKTKKAVFLFDYTGMMAKPWADAGYTCFCFDGQHPKGVTKSSHENILNVGMWFSTCATGDQMQNDMDKISFIVGDDVSFLFSFPECTDLATSGALNFKAKAEANPLFQEEAMQLFYLTEALGDHFGCPWGLENPVSVASSIWRKSDFTFNPFEFGGYLPEGDKHPTYPQYIKARDAYPKRTCIWVGGGFIKPEKKEVEVDNGYSDQYKKLGGKSLKTKNIRSATPRGFAQAVFEANSEDKAGC